MSDEPDKEPRARSRKWRRIQKKMAKSDRRMLAYWALKDLAQKYNLSHQELVDTAHNIGHVIDWQNYRRNQGQPSGQDEERERKRRAP